MAKTEKISLRITKEERKRLEREAAQRGMSESAYLRLLLSQKPDDYPEIRVLLKDLINEVNRIGANINQIVKRNNGGYYSESDKTRLVAYMRKLIVAVDEAVRKIGKGQLEN